MRTLAITIALLVASGARAEADGTNWLVGLVFGIRLNGPGGAGGVIGVEGGVGAGPERINLGFEHRAGKTLGYLEVDPWFVVGGTLGLAIDSDGNPEPVLGLWEGAPLKLPSCGIGREHYDTTISIAGGYRYTGVHELYITIKAGISQPICFD
ncbi:MAG: hypothetical protein E6J91_21895 [Deltaproteobacteria bacterium]|nr:MAG: hypothetical protein E6J91_21895 [Deltaproteobacteria bacterium]